MNAQFYLVISLLLFVQLAIAQKQPIHSKDAISIELGGHGAFYSFNYERTLLFSTDGQTIAQLGVAYYPPSADVIELWIPVSINQLVRFAPYHYGEIGAGMMVRREYKPVHFDFCGFSTEKELTFDTGILRLGYRYQPNHRRFYFKAAYTPIYETLGELFNGERFSYRDDLIHTVGIAVGWRL